MSVNEFNPWERLERLMGKEALRRLSRSHVMVIGLGGVGSYAVEALARCGVGRFTLIDFDTVQPSNINRQLPAFPSTVGEGKARLMAERVYSINPSANVVWKAERFQMSTADSLLNGAPDMLVDCIDLLGPKAHLIAEGVRRKIPTVTSLGAACRLDPTRVRVTDLGKTHGDALGRLLRKRLRRRYDIICRSQTGIMAVYSDEPRAMAEELEESDEALEAAVEGRNEAEVRVEAGPRERPILGSVVFVTATFGMTVASVVVRRLCSDKGSDQDSEQGSEKYSEAARELT